MLTTRPVAVRYSITPLGMTLRHPVDVLLAWASEAMPEIEQARARYEAAEDGEGLEG